MFRNWETLKVGMNSDGTWNELSTKNFNLPSELVATVNIPSHGKEC
jgi:hypothetical protein